jgi:Polyketide cyclase / dehydrase and lipid transport
MASIQKEVLLEVGVERAWAALRDVGHADRLFAGVLVEAKLEDDVRTVKFKNGMVAREQILDVDDERRRVAYAALGAPFTHHNASMQVFAEPGGRSRFVWNSDFLPADLAADVGPLVEAGCRALKQNLESQTH